MSVFSGPNVLDSNLIFSFDSLNYKSYSPNLLGYSQQFADSYWNKSIVLYSTSETAPDGTNTATLLGDNNATSYLNLFRSITIPNNSNTYNMSVYLKKTSGGTAPMPGFNGRFTGGTVVNVFPRVNTDTGVTTAGTMQDLGNWWRLNFDITNNSTGNTVLEYNFFPATRFQNDVADNAAAVGNATIWGSQVTLGSGVKPYYPTTNITGAVWADTTNNFQNGNAFNIIPYDVTERAFDFTGASGINSGGASIGFTFTSNPIPTTGNFTISAWLKQTTDSGQTGLFSNAGSADGYRFGPAGGGIYYGIGPTWSEGVLGSGTFSLNTWVNLVAVYDRNGSLSSGTPRVFGYINGNLVGTVSLSSQTASTNAVPGIVRSACCQIFKGYLSNLTGYNKSLTEIEVRQNFNALRGRYGI
jgi:hypothetical protein